MLQMGRDTRCPAWLLLIWLAFAASVLAAVMWHWIAIGLLPLVVVIAKGCWRKHNSLRLARLSNTPIGPRRCVVLRDYDLPIRGIDDVKSE